MVFLPARTVQQVAALPFVPLGGGFEVLLITSRQGGRWLVPKGWPSGNRSLADAAVSEAYEEAGIVGIVHPEPLGTYSYRKAMAEGYRVRCHVFVYPFLVRQHCLEWRERGERSLRWSGLAEAARLVEDRGLAALFSELAASDGAPLHDAMTAMEQSAAAAEGGHRAVPAG